VVVEVETRGGQVQLVRVGGPAVVVGEGRIYEEALQGA
jgi:hypothetical protein